MQDGRPRAKEPLLLCALATGRYEKLMALMWRDDIKEEYSAVAELLQGADLSAIALNGVLPEGLPREYAKRLNTCLLYTS